MPVNKALDVEALDEIGISMVLSRVERAWSGFLLVTAQFKGSIPQDRSYNSIYLSTTKLIKRLLQHTSVSELRTEYPSSVPPSLLSGDLLDYDEEAWEILTAQVLRFRATIERHKQLVLQKRHSWPERKLSLLVSRIEPLVQDSEIFCRNVLDYNQTTVAEQDSGTLFPVNATPTISGDGTNMVLTFPRGGIPVKLGSKSSRVYLFIKHIIDQNKRFISSQTLLDIAGINYQEIGPHELHEKAMYVFRYMRSELSRRDLQQRLLFEKSENPTGINLRTP